MTDPQIIVDDTVRGRSFLTDLIHNEIYSNQIGISKNCCDIDSNCLLFIINAIQYRLDEELYDNTLEKLHRELILIIGNYTPVTLSRFYYGFKNTIDLLTESEILASNYIEFPYGTYPVIPYVYTSTPKYQWMAEYNNEPIKTKWQDTVVLFNNGNIGDISDLFGVPITVGIFKFYNTNYATQFQYPIQFKVV